jgi:hypothetical protein
MQNQNSNSSANSGLFSTLLTIAFIVLKLCNVIAWSWWWVLSPIWIGIAIVLLFIGGILVYELLKKD